MWGQDGWTLAKFFFCMFMFINSQKKNEANIQPSWPNKLGQYKKDLLYGFWWNFACGIQRVVPSGQDGSILPSRVANHSARFGSSYPLTELAICFAWASQVFCMFIGWVESKSINTQKRTRPISQVILTQQDWWLENIQLKGWKQNHAKWRFWFFFPQKCLNVCMSFPIE